MTQSISSEENRSETRITEISILGMIGYSFFMSVQLGAMYSPIMCTQTTSTPFLFCLMRAISIAVTTVVYIAISRLIKSRDLIIRSTAIKIIGFLGQLVLPVLTMVERFTGIVIPLPLMILAWVLWGIFHSFLSCTWIDAKSHVDQNSTSKISFWSFAITAFLLAITLSLPFGPALILIFFMQLVACLVSLAAPQYKEDESDIEQGQSWLKRSKFRKTGSYILLIDGTIITFSASIMILSVVSGNSTVPLVGIGYLFAVVIFFALNKLDPATLSLERSQLVFLPVVACGLILIGMGQNYLWMPIIGALLLFVTMAMIDYANRTILTLRGSLLSVSPSYCYSKGRFFMLAGEALGWILAMLAVSPIGEHIIAIVAAGLLILETLYVALGAIVADKYSLVDTELYDEIPDEIVDASEEIEAESVSDDLDSENDDQSLNYRFKKRCLATTQEYDLTPREGEILSFLARGRNAKYIAEQLFVAERTIKTHAYHIYQKMGIHSQQELISIVENTKFE